MNDVRIDTYKFRKGDIWQVNSSMSEVADWRPAIIVEDTRKKDHYSSEYIMVALISASTNFTNYFNTIDININKDVNSKIMLNNIIALPIDRFSKFIGFVNESDIDYICKSISDMLTLKSEALYEKRSENSELSDIVMGYFNKYYTKSQQHNIGFKTFQIGLEEECDRRLNPKTIVHILDNNGIICKSGTIYNVIKKTNLEIVSEKISTPVVQEVAPDPKPVEQSSVIGADTFQGTITKNVDNTVEVVHGSKGAMPIPHKVEINSSMEEEKPKYNPTESVNKLKTTLYVDTSRTASIIMEEKAKKISDTANRVFNSINEKTVQFIAKIFNNIIGDGLKNNDMLETYINDNFKYITKESRYKIKTDIRRLMVEAYMPESSYSDIRKMKTSMKKESGNSNSFLNLLEYRIQNSDAKKKKEEPKEEQQLPSSNNVSTISNIVQPQSSVELNNLDRKDYDSMKRKPLIKYKKKK